MSHNAKYIRQNRGKGDGGVRRQDDPDVHPLRLEIRSGDMARVKSHAPYARTRRCWSRPRASWPQEHHPHGEGRGRQGRAVRLLRLQGAQAPFRSLWIQRINAAARTEGFTYSLFIHGLAEADLMTARCWRISPIDPPRSRPSPSVRAAPASAIAFTLPEKPSASRRRAFADCPTLRNLNHGPTTPIVFAQRHPGRCARAPIRDMAGW